MKRIRKRRLSDSIPVAAMGDVAFLLMIFYMTTTLVTDQKPRFIETPRIAEAANMPSPYPLVIYLDQTMANQGRVYFFNEAVPLDDLAALVQERAALAPGAVRVYLSIERNLPYRKLNEVVQALKDAGVRNLVITTRPPEREP
jgi:biopolymer transport protein ExbD